MPKRLIFVADHRPQGEIYRYVRHRGIERLTHGMNREQYALFLQEVGTRANIPHGKGRAAALRKARGLAK